MASNLPITLFAFVFTLGLVIIVHELGHFLMCKLFGIYVKTFSIGIGPKLLRKRVGETEYTISAIPFGGYVKMAGEGIMEEIQDTGTLEGRKYPLGTQEGNLEAARQERHIPPERHFNHKPAWQRLAVFVSGPLANLLLAFVLYAGIVMQGGLVEIPVTRIGGVQPGSPAAAAGLEVGDQVLTVGGQTVAVWNDVLAGIVTPSQEDPERPVAVELGILRQGRMIEVELAPRWDARQGGFELGIEPWDTAVGLVQRGGPADVLGLRQGDVILAVDDSAVTSFNGIARIINHAPGRPVRIVWERGGEVMEGTVVPEMAQVEVDSSVGRIFFDREYLHRPVPPGRALAIGVEITWRTIEMILDVLKRFLTFDLGLEEVGGPIRIGQVAGQMLRWSFGHLVQFIAFFSVNLFLLNLLPIPVLDGGHVLFLLVEVVRGRPAPERVQAIATQVGLILLLLLMTFIVVMDVLKVTGH